MAATVCGVPAEDQERIFLEFQQVKTGGGAEKPEGTDLGLALVKKFVEMHGGILWVESEAGKGSRFFFILHQQADLAANVGAGNFLRRPQSLNTRKKRGSRGLSLTRRAPPNG